MAPSDFVSCSFISSRSSRLKRRRRRLAGAISSVLSGMAAVFAALAHGASAVPSGPAPQANVAVATPQPLGKRQWVTARRSVGRLSSKELGLIINRADPYSREVGFFYAKARGLKADQVLEVDLPVKANLAPEEFAHLAAQVRAYFGNNIQALALAWTLPYAVECNSITAALTLGFDARLCAQTCAASRPSPYFNSASSRPYRDLQLRPSMMLAAHNIDQAKALIARGVAADASLGLRGAPPARALFEVTSDPARNVRASLYPPAGLLKRVGVDVHVEASDRQEAFDDVVLYLTGSTQVANLQRIRWLPGALADHLTSFGGRLAAGAEQMSVLAWIDAGVTASYGTVSEPCNHLQKFPHPQLLLQHYVQGATAIEAYWKSVAWPQQGVFVGEPLAAPFARR